MRPLRSIGVALAAATALILGVALGTLAARWLR